MNIFKRLKQNPRTAYCDKMPSDEVIEILKHERDEMAEKRGSDYSGVEALDVAIKALKIIDALERYEFDESSVKTYQVSREVEEGYYIKVFDLQKSIKEAMKN